MDGDLFSAGFAWGDVATDATPAATPAPPGAPVKRTAVSQPCATPTATDATPSFSGNFAWADGGVATVASVADEDVSQHGVADTATPVATLEAPGNGGFDGPVGGAVASVASVAEWRAGVDLMARSTDWPQIACCNWALLLSDARSFINLWGDDAVRFGWTTLELFGTNRQPNARRVDHLGLVQLLQGRAIQSLDRRTALIGTGTGEMTFDRTLVAAGGVAIWDLLTVTSSENARQMGQGPAGDRGRGVSALKRLPPTAPVCQPALREPKRGEVR